jgi:hypothetical protein
MRSEKYGWWRSYDRPRFGPRFFWPGLFGISGFTLRNANKIIPTAPHRVTASSGPLGQQLLTSRLTRFLRMKFNDYCR